MDIYTLLRQDHQRIRELFERIATTEEGTGEPPNGSFDALRRALSVHREAEERTFYAALSTLPEIADSIEEALEEHVDIAELIEELASVEDDPDAFMPQLAELREEVEYHVDSEENTIFPQAQRFLSAEQAEKLAAEFEVAKEQVAGG